VFTDRNSTVSQRSTEKNVKVLESLISSDYVLENIIMFFILRILSLGAW